MRTSLNISLVESKAPGRTIFDLVKLPRLGVVLLATLAQKIEGVQATVHVEEIAPLDIDEIARADVVGISTTTSTSPSAYALCDEVRIRNPRAVIALGGVHVTFNVEEALEHCDHVFVGEADLTFTEFISKVKSGEDSPKVIGHRLRDSFSEQLRRSDVDDIDCVPDLTLIRGWSKMHIAPITTSRSCPFSCTFCSVIEMFGQRMRYASLDSIRRNLEQAHEMKLGSVFFYDDNFVVDEKRTMRILQMIRELPFKFRWSAQVRANSFADRPQLARAMAAAGCRMVYVGIESPDPDTLLAMHKRTSVLEMTEGVRNLRRAGILVHGMFVTGTQLDTPASIRRSLKYAIKERFSTVQFMILTPLPGTQDHDRLEKCGRIFDHDWTHYDAHHTVYHPELMSAQRLQRETFRAMRKFYSPLRLLTPYLENLPRFKQSFWTMCLRGFGWAHIRAAIRGLRRYTSELPTITQANAPVSTATARQLS